MEAGSSAFTQTAKRYFSAMARLNGESNSSTGSPSAIYSYTLTPNASMWWYWPDVQDGVGPGHAVGDGLPHLGVGYLAPERHAGSPAACCGSAAQTLRRQTCLPAAAVCRPRPCPPPAGGCRGCKSGRPHSRSPRPRGCAPPGRKNPPGWGSWPPCTPVWPAPQRYSAPSKVQGTTTASSWRVVRVSAPLYRKAARRRTGAGRYRFSAIWAGAFSWLSKMTFLPRFFSLRA